MWLQWWVLSDLPYLTTFFFFQTCTCRTVGISIYTCVNTPLILSLTFSCPLRCGWTNPPTPHPSTTWLNETMVNICDVFQGGTMALARWRRYGNNRVYTFGDIRLVYVDQHETWSNEQEDIFVYSCPSILLTILVKWSFTSFRRS